MLSILASFALIAWLLSPSRDHLRTDISLEDRRRMECRGSSMDGRRPNVSAYAPRADLDLHSSDGLIVCQQKILAPGLRSAKIEDLLQNTQPFTERLLRQMQGEQAWKTKAWQIEVLIAAPLLQQKLSFAVKTRLVQADYQVLNRAKVSESLIASGLDEWRERCSSLPTDARLFVYLANPQSSLLSAAACTEEGWKWL